MERDATDNDQYLHSSLSIRTIPARVLFFLKRGESEDDEGEKMRSGVGAFGVVRGRSGSFGGYRESISVTSAVTTEF